MDISKTKTFLLKMPFITARSRLLKKIVFNLAQELKKDVCFRCNKKIEIVDDFTIDHKISWQLSKNPIEMFFNLDNIAFSHYSCNSKSTNSFNKRKTHCKNGHEFNKENTHIRDVISGYRDCKICKRNREQKYRKNNGAFVHR